MLNDKDTIKKFITELKDKKIIPTIIPEVLGEEILSTKNLNTPGPSFSSFSTALGLAAEQGDHSLVKELLSLGADPKKVRPDYKTLLHVAAMNGNLDVVKFTTRTMPLEFITLTDAEENNVFHLACENNQNKIIEYLQKDPRLQPLINKINIIGNTPLDIALSKKNDDAIHLLNPKLKISECSQYGKTKVILSQDHLESKLMDYVSLTKVDTKSEDVIFKYGMCNGWSWLRQIYLTQGKEDEYLALLTVIATWNGTREDLENQDLPPSLKKKYQKIFPDGRTEPATVGFVFENFIHTLSVAFSETKSFKALDLKILQDDRIKQYDLLKSPTDKRILKNIFNIPRGNYNKAQLTEIFEFLSMWPGLSMDITSKGHAVTLQVTPGGFFDYYDSGLPGPVDHFMTVDELVNHTLKTDLHLDFKVSAYKFYEADEPIPETEMPSKKAFSNIYSPNGYTALHLAVLENNHKKIERLLRDRSQDNHSLDSHGFTPLKLALRANHPVCFLSLLSYNQKKPIYHSDQLDFSEISEYEYSIDRHKSSDLSFPPYLTTLDECLLLIQLMEKGDISKDFTDKNGLTLSDALPRYSGDHRYIELSRFIHSQDVGKHRKMGFFYSDNASQDHQSNYQDSKTSNPSNKKKPT